MGYGIYRSGIDQKLATLLLLLCLNTQATVAATGTSSVPNMQAVEGLELPEGVSLHSTPEGAHYLKISRTRAHSLIKPAVQPRATLMANWAKKPHFAAVINGGFFIADRPVSLAVRDGELLAENITAVTRNGTQLPVRRSAFWMDSAGNARIGWVARDKRGALRAFPAPIRYRIGTKEVPPHASVDSGEVIYPRWAIGGGPRLVNGGEVAITFAEEVFWGSGVTLEELRPRSAICLTESEGILLFVTPSARLDALAEQLRVLGCKEAMNLDGGGSSAMYVAGRKILDQERPVPAVLAVLQQ